VVRNKQAGLKPPDVFSLFETRQIVTKQEGFDRQASAKMVLHHTTNTLDDEWLFTRCVFTLPVYAGRCGFFSTSLGPPYHHRENLSLPERMSVVFTDPPHTTSKTHCYL
jgi:hypothetical protein